MSGAQQALLTLRAPSTSGPPGPYLVEVDMSGAENATFMANLGTDGGSMTSMDFATGLPDASMMYLTASPHNKSARAARHNLNSPSGSQWYVGASPVAVAEDYTFEVYIAFAPNGSTANSGNQNIAMGPAADCLGRIQYYYNRPAYSVVSLEMYINGYGSFVIINNVTPDIYHHFAVCLSAGGLISFFMDGALILTETYVGSRTSPALFQSVTGSVSAPTPYISIDYVRAARGFVYTAPFTPP